MDLVIKKGKNCVALARKTVTAINQGNVEQASSQLASLKTTGEELAERSGNLSKRLEKVQECNQEQEENTQREIAKCGQEERRLQSQVASAQSNLSNQQSYLQSKRSNLSDADNALGRAQRKLRDAKEEADKTRTGAAILGGVLGLCAGGIGGVVIGAAAGVHVGQLINELRDEEDKAKRRLNDCQRECSNAEREVAKAKEQVLKIQSQITSLLSQKHHFEQQRIKYQKEASKLREAIVFLQKSVDFWSMFQHLCDTGVDQSSHLQNIISIAESNTNISVLHEDPTNKLAVTFLDAWEQIYTQAEEGSTHHVFQIEFNCTKCNAKYSDLPQVQEGKVVCNNCYKHSIM